MSPVRIVAIDGPAGSGKSTVARRVAAALGHVYIDTGAIYRALGLAAKRQNLALDDGPALADLARGLDLRFEPGPEGQVVKLAGEDVSIAIRSSEISMAASRVSARPEVRAALLQMQRTLAHGSGITGAVLEGRDIGTVVFPEAQLKIFLDADPVERARRRHAELQARGQESSLQAVTAELATRDANDRNRTHAPLRQAADAVRLDTTPLDVDGVIEAILQLAEARFGSASAESARLGEPSSGRQRSR